MNSKGMISGWKRNLVLVGIVALLHTVSMTAGAVEVTFPDPGLDAAVRWTLGLTSEPITDSDLATISGLDASYWGISDLTGIEYCTALEGLDLTGNAITDLTPLEGLTNLEVLFADGNYVSDLTPLTGLPNLSVLSLSSNSIIDAAPLTSLPALTGVDVSCNPLSQDSLDTVIPALLDYVPEVYFGNDACTVSSEGEVVVEGEVLPEGEWVYEGEWGTHEGEVVSMNEGETDDSGSDWTDGGDDSGSDNSGSDDSGWDDNGSDGSGSQEGESGSGSHEGESNTGGNTVIDLGALKQQLGCGSQSMTVDGWATDAVLMLGTGALLLGMRRRAAKSR